MWEMAPRESPFSLLPAYLRLFVCPNTLPSFFTRNLTGRVQLTLKGCLDPQTTHKNGISPTTILWVKPIFKELDWELVWGPRDPFQPILEKSAGPMCRSQQVNGSTGLVSCHATNRASQERSLFFCLNPQNSNLKMGLTLQNYGVISNFYG